jgi:exodeoxyribonuclease-3
VAPDERDVYDPLLWANSVLFSGPERAAFHRLVGLGLVDLLREHHGDDPIYTWWDYRFNAFNRRRGLRIDHILASPALARHCVSADVDTTPRGWERPSDHAPIVAQFDL